MTDETAKPAPAPPVPMKQIVLDDVIRLATFGDEEVRQGEEPPKPDKPITPDEVDKGA
jgi:hypothetical protein